MSGIWEDKKRQGRRKSKPFPLGMRELLTLAAACETEGIGRAASLEDSSLGPKLSRSNPASTQTLQPHLTSSHAPKLPYCLSDVSYDRGGGD